VGSTVVLRARRALVKACDNFRSVYVNQGKVFSGLVQSP
jgi:hypothetical protein